MSSAPTPARWSLDEDAHAGSEHLDPAFVAGYDRKQGADPGPDVAAVLAQGVGADSTVVELGAGTGTFALALAPHVRSVVAVDVAPAMLAYLRDRADRAGIGNVTAVRGGFLSYEHDGPAVDAVTTRHALHQLPDFWKVVALDRIAALLRPGGVLHLRDMIFDCEPGEVTEVVTAWLAGGAADPALGYTADDYAEHLREEYSTFRWLLEPMLDRAGFDVVDVSYEGRIYGTWTCRRR